MRLTYESTLKDEIARRKLAKIRQERSLQEYVNEFRKIVLDIPDITPREQYLAFVEGLKDHHRAQVALTANNSVELAIVHALKLDHYKDVYTRPTNRGQGEGGGKKFFRGGRKPFAKQYARVANSKPTDRGKGKGKKWSEGNKRPVCFLCGKEGHTVKECYQLAKAQKAIKGNLN